VLRNELAIFVYGFYVVKVRLVVFYQRYAITVIPAFLRYGINMLATLGIQIFFSAITANINKLALVGIMS
jgi:hypothetical protein